jgi:tetratricopeptide (TPR) repeat protein
MATEPLELPDQLHAEIQRLCAEGDALAEESNYASALEKYWEAFDLLPDPKENWSAGTWILAAIGDANFLSGDFTAGKDNLAMAMRFPEALGNPFFHLRLGQCQFELGNLDRAADELMRAYMGHGPDLFKDEDPKYLVFLSTRAKGIELPGQKKKGWKFWEK